MLHSVCVFTGSRMGSRPEYRVAAETTGAAIAAAGLRLIYGGGAIGLMRVVADAALAHGGEVVGVIPEDLQSREIRHEGLTELHVVSSMHERKMLMAKLSDGMVALPGGLGTLEELFEVLTWAQLGFHHKPIGLLNVVDYFGGMLAFLDATVQEGFVAPEHRAMLLTGSAIEPLLAQMQAASHETPPKSRDLAGA